MWSPPATPIRSFHGRVAMIGDTLDPETRTISRSGCRSESGDEASFPACSLPLHIAEPATRDAVFVPEDALQNINGMPVVFVHDRWDNVPGPHRDRGHAVYGKKLKSSRD